ncbi:hypothetical protein MKS88_005505 [Plasmodium brasilianum]|uniref:Uncharacterized protein n=2 Tax=Plasmodium (Plasmodium) TaxID=418103 RepID=A0A1A8WFG8_PLAMA|nr:conserved Plasmodium protein, unknown function [Plasmodium malariae]KAI4834826.1 hypothetical protein MKS88_005505 [Plasmodium brasilianum]SBS90547.1 conserved Plasmodium protein, unknown function [Plasmodium malariae]SCP03386.1 conserved Plasmodium protein, unknown function [Plasmodium malariae]
MMTLRRIRRAWFSSDVNISNLLRKKAILFENVKRENCKKELILNYFNMKGVKLKSGDIHIMTNIFCRPTGRIIVLIDDIKKQNFNFNFDTHNRKEHNADTENIAESCNTEKNGMGENNNSLHDSSDVINSEKNKKTYCQLSSKEDNKLFVQKDNQTGSETTSSKRWNMQLKNMFKDCKIHLCDDYEIEKFIEECERFLRFTEDIKRIAKFENLNKIVTIINIPSCYGRKEVAQIIFDCAKINVELKNIIFRFKKNGIQSDCAYVLCNNINDANIILNKMQEYPVAKKYHLKEFFGTCFLYASKNNLFISSDKLDYITIFSKYKIFTCGWHKDISIKEFESFLITLKIFPNKIIKINYNTKVITDDIRDSFDSQQRDEKDGKGNGINGIVPDKIKANEVSHKRGNNVDSNTSNKYQLSHIDYNHILINIEEFCSSMSIYDKLNEANELNTSSFILFFENMRMTKKVFTKFERLKKKWKMSATNNFYAYPKIPDIHFNDDENYKDENDYEDSDLDEEIEY